MKDTKLRFILCCYLVQGLPLTSHKLYSFFSCFNFSYPKTTALLKKYAKSDFIALETGKDGVYIIKVVQKAKDYLEKSLPALRFHIKKWDRIWRLVTYEIPESQRDLRDFLRRELQKMSFIPWHRSFWVCPYDLSLTLKSFLEESKTDKYVHFFEAKYVYGNREAFESTLNIEYTKNLYKEVYKDWHTVMDRFAKKEITREIAINELIMQFMFVVKHDYGLPHELLGGDMWPGKDFYKDFTHLIFYLIGNEG